MKTIKFISLLLAIIVLATYGCKKKNEENNDQTNVTADYNTVATVFVTYPHVYSFGVTGTTHTVCQGSTFSSTSNFLMGQTAINNVMVNGTVESGQVTFTNKQFLLVFPVLGGADTIREEVTFSTGPISMSSNPITGNGPMVLRMADDTTTERGTFTYTLTKVK